MHARVPIIKAQSHRGRFDVDISTSYNDNGSDFARLVGQRLEHYPYLRPLLAVTKQYLGVIGLDQVCSGGISSLTLICLITAYLAVRLSP